MKRIKNSQILTENIEENYEPKTDFEDTAEIEEEGHDTVKYD